MGRKRRHQREQSPQDRNSPSPAEIVPADSAAIPSRLSPLMTCIALVALYAWILSWWNGFVYTFYTTHVRDNFSVIMTFLDLLTSLRFGLVVSYAGDVAFALAIFSAAFALGRMALDAFRVELGDWGRVLKPMALGLGLLSTILLALGLAGLWTTPILASLVIIPLVIGLIRHAPEFTAWLKTLDAAAWNREASGWEIFGFVLLAAYLLMNLMGALGPEYFYDSLVYHLALPKLYLLEHRIVPTPSMIYSGVPFGTEMLYGLGLAFGTENLAKLIHYGCGVAIAGAVYSWSRRLVNRNVAILATLLFYSVPMVCFESTTATIELTMTLYILVSALIIIEVVGREPNAPDSKALILAGVLAGFGFGTKYNAGLYIPVLTLPLLIGGARPEGFDWKNTFRRVGFFLGSAAAVSSPWLVKNWFFYRNPVYPFLQVFFSGTHSADIAGLKADAHARDLISVVSTWSGMKNFFVGVWDLRLHNFTENVGVGLEIGLPWLILVRWKSREHQGLLGLIVGIWLAWALHTSLPRFILPAIPFLCILIATAIVSSDIPRLLRFCATGFAYYTVTISFVAIFLMVASSATWKVAYGRISREEYLLHEHPAYTAPYYAGVRFINQNLPNDVRILFIGEERGFYCERKFITASWFDVNPIVGLADSAASSDALALSLRRKGITHLLINTGSEHYQKWLNGLSPENQSKFNDLLRHDAKLVFDYNKQLAPNDRSWVQVYELANPDASKTPA